MKPLIDPEDQNGAPDLLIPAGWSEPMARAAAAAGLAADTPEGADIAARIANCPRPSPPGPKGPNLRRHWLTCSPADASRLTRL